MGDYLSKPLTYKEREDGEGPHGLRYAAVSMQGWRLTQEDAHIALPFFDKHGDGLGLFGVFDGHCGGVVSKLVAQWLPEKLRKTPAYKAGNYAAALHQSFLALDQQLDSRAGRHKVHSEAVELQMKLANSFQVDQSTEDTIDLDEALDVLCCDNPDSMGCTAVVALVEYGSAEGSSECYVHVANCGDSRCVLWDAHGKVTAMSKDHKPRNKEERARVESAGGWVSSEGRIEGNLNLSRALGDFEYKRTRKTQRPEEQMISGVPDVRSYKVRPQDRYLMLACDGVWETRIGSQATVDVACERISASRKGKLSNVLAHLLSKTIAKDAETGLGMDNMTAVMVEFPVVDAGSRATVQRPPRVLKKPAAAREKKTVKRKIHKKPASR